MTRRLDSRGRRAARFVRLERPEVPARDPWRLRVARRLRWRLGGPVEVEVTDNTYTMISFSRRGAAYRVRVHHMFVGADDALLERLAGYIRGDDRAASATLDDYIHANRRLIRHVPPVQRQQRLPLATAGRQHDLAAMFAEVQAEYRSRLDDETRDVAIGWAPAPRVRLPRRSIKLGSYSADTQVIRIHPALDQPEVPAFFVRWIILHELLHHRFRADLKARNGLIHTPEFRRLERSFPGFRAALAWEKRHLDLLLWWCPDLVGEGLHVG